MIAGTVLVFGECGIRPGAGMRRGTLGLMGPNPPALLSTFRFAARSQSRTFQIIVRHLQRQGFRVDESLWSADLDLYRGDLVALGKGEVFLRHAA
jgi:formylmethanofuran dehydrogenase subunit C